jgi:hypothetical protein
MDLNYSEHELWTMIEALASGRGNLQERAVLTNKYLVPLKLEHVPEALRGELQTLKTSGASAQRMSETNARNRARNPFRCSSEMQYRSFPVEVQ